MSAGFDFFLMDDGGEDFSGASNLTVRARAIAQDYSTSESYSAGDYVMWNGLLYVCTSATSGAWDSNDWMQLSAMDAITEEARQIREDLEAEIEAELQPITYAQIDALFLD